MSDTNLTEIPGAPRVSAILTAYYEKEGKGQEDEERDLWEPLAVMERQMEATRTKMMEWMDTANEVSRQVVAAKRQLAAARSAFGNIRTMIDGRIDVNRDGDGCNIFGYIDNECAVGLGEAP